MNEIRNLVKPVIALAAEGVFSKCLHSLFASCLCLTSPGYDGALDTRAVHAFGTAAFRFGHTLIASNLTRASSGYDLDNNLQLSMVSFHQYPNIS